MKVDVQIVARDISAWRYKGRVIHVQRWQGDTPPKWGKLDNSGVLRVVTLDVSDTEMAALESGALCVADEKVRPVPSEIVARMDDFEKLHQIGEYSEMGEATSGISL